VLKSNRWPR